MKKIFALAGIGTILLATSMPLFASDNGGRQFHARGGQDSHGERDYKPKDEAPQRVSAPEIDAKAGAAGVAILIAAMLLAAEGMRRRR